ncbi:ESX secretion-associated protein EspG [Amycolatopsis sp. NPDC059021]|uniref:ESX secretion-associated protein EspG n=1 Tax=Amycolatopsis sp. NPDC059021 TaxID=3346704 RepID=UPI003670B24B
MHRGTVLLPKSAFITAWRWEGYGDPPAVIGIDEQWLPEQTRAKYDNEVLSILTGLGVAEGGTLTREFRDTLAVLATGSLRFTAWCGDVQNDETGGILVSVKGNEAVRVLRTETLVRIDPVDAGRAAAAVVDALPDVGPARLETVAVPKAAYRPDQGISAAFDFNDPTSEEPDDPTARPRALMAGRRSGIHQLYVGNGAGRRSTPVTVVDVVGEGRVIALVSENLGDEPMLTFLAASRAALIDVLETTSATFA